MDQVRRARVLVLTDHPLERHIFAELLNEAGYAVAIAESEADALRVVADQPPDAIVFDLHMNCDAWRMLKAFCPDALLVVVGHFTTESQAQHMGAAAFVGKRDYGGVVDAVREVLAKHGKPPKDERPAYEPPVADSELLRRAVIRARQRIRQARIQRELEVR